MRRFKTTLTLAVTALLAALAVPVSAGTLTLSWDANPEPEVAGYVVHIGSEPGVYTMRVDVGDATTYVMSSAAEGRRYCFAVAAYFPGPVEGGRSSEVCSGGDQPPTLANPGPQSHPLGAALTLALSATDPEGAPMTFSATGLPEGLRIAAGSGVISGTPTRAGTSTVRVKVTDGVSGATQEFSWTIGASGPQAPTLLRPSGAQPTATPIFEWQAVATATRYRVWVDDASTVNPRLQVDLTVADLGCSAAGSTCRYAPGATLAAGAASWSVRASNTSGDGPWSGAMDFSVPGAGRAPSVAILSPTAAGTYATTSASFAFGGTATDDVKVTQVTWSNDRGGAGAAVGTSTWVALGIALKAGANVITVTARDAEGNTASAAITVTRGEEGDTLPKVTVVNPAGGRFKTSVATVNLSGTAGAASGVAQVSWTNSLGGGGVASGTTAWTIRGLTLAPGDNEITVTARDSAGQSGTARVTLTRLDTQMPTVSITTPSRGTHTTTSRLLSLAGTADDAFGVTQVNWSNDRGGSGRASGTSVWTIPAIALQPGVNLIAVTARDAAGNSARDVVKVRFEDSRDRSSRRAESGSGTAGDALAILAPTADQSWTTGASTVTLKGVASDNVVRVTWAVDWGGSGTASGTGQWSIPTIGLQIGTNRIAVTAHGATGAVAERVVTVTYTPNTASR